MAKFNVLLVDDEEELVTALVERLKYRDIHAEYALDGYDALIKMRNAAFEVVVLDLKLPGMDGAEVLRRLNMEYPLVPVLLITGHGTADVGNDIRPEGAVDYLPKPINIEDLIVKMEKAVSKHE